jgi:hypothetical protein
MGEGFASAELRCSEAKAEKKLLTMSITLLEPGQISAHGISRLCTKQVSAEMCLYNISLLGLSETRCLQARQTRLISGKLLYLGNENEYEAHTKDITTMLSGTALKILTG